MSKVRIIIPLSHRREDITQPPHVSPGTWLRVTSHPGGAEKVGYSVDSRFAGLDFAFPDDEDPPSCFHELLLVALVPLHVAGELRLPELLARLWHIGLLATVPMPEAPMNEDCRASSRKNQIGATAKLADMRAEAIATGVKSASHEQFGLRVHATDADP